jgi:hypothetical protein
MGQFDDPFEYDQIVGITLHFKSKEEADACIRRVDELMKETHDMIVARGKLEKPWWKRWFR